MIAHTYRGNWAALPVHQFVGVNSNSNMPYFQPVSLSPFLATVYFSPERLMRWQGAVL